MWVRDLLTYKSEVSNVEINELRNKIDDLDEEILKLLNKRTEIALKIGKLKSNSDSSYYVPHREQAIIKRLTDINIPSYFFTQLNIFFLCPCGK